MNYKKEEIQEHFNDWIKEQDENWINYENKLKVYGVMVRYIPYTKSVSSTLINNILTEKRK